MPDTDHKLPLTPDTAKSRPDDEVVEIVNRGVPHLPDELFAGSGVGASSNFARTQELDAPSEAVGSASSSSAPKSPLVASASPAMTHMHSRRRRSGPTGLVLHHWSNDQRQEPRSGRVWHESMESEWKKFIQDKDRRDLGTEDNNTLR